MQSSALVSLEALLDRLQTGTDISDFWEVHQKLKRYSKRNRVAILEAYLKRMRAEPIGHVAAAAASECAKLVEYGEVQYLPAFESALGDTATAYWSLLGVAKCLEKKSYSTLTSFALDPANATDARAHATKLLSNLSGQTFVRGLPRDPGYWEPEQLPLLALSAWKEAGFPDGPGFTVPAVSSALTHPVSEVDRLAVSLERKLRRYRAKEQDLAEPTNWLVPADDRALQDLLLKWALPPRYLEFLSKFSPLKVTLRRRLGNDMNLYGATELLDAQHGYSWNPETSTPIPDWNPNHLVIADEGGDPYVLDLAAAVNSDCPVLHAFHGQGDWSFWTCAPTFTRFLKNLSRVNFRISW